MSGWADQFQVPFEAGGIGQNRVINISSRLAVKKIKVKPAVFSRVFLNETSQNNSQLLEGGGAPNSSQFQAKAAGAAEVSKRAPVNHPCGLP